MSRKNFDKYKGIVDPEILAKWQKIDDQQFKARRKITERKRVLNETPEQKKKRKQAPSIIASTIANNTCLKWLGHGSKKYVQQHANELIKEALQKAHTNYLRDPTRYHKVTQYTKKYLVTKLKYFFDIDITIEEMNYDVPN